MTALSTGSISICCRRTSARRLSVVTSSAVTSLAGILSGDGSSGDGAGMVGVPEPGTLALLLGGLLGLFAYAWKKRK